MFGIDVVGGRARRSRQPWGVVTVPGEASVPSRSRLGARERGADDLLPSAYNSETGDCMAQAARPFIAIVNAT